jgi:hypothetical protein
MFGIEKDFQNLMEQVYGPLNKNKMTEFQPKPQTHEEVAEGLRNAFRQAKKDGVMDATPYLKQMNPNREIELLKQEIKMLQSKLSFLDELERQRPITLQRIIGECMINHNSCVQLELGENILDRVEVEWFPLEGCHELKSYDYSAGWNDCIKHLKKRVRE